MLAGRRPNAKWWCRRQCCDGNVGAYDLLGATGRNIGIASFTLSLENGQLFAALNGKGHVPMTPTSESMFSSRLLSVQFFVDPSGNVVRVLSIAAEGTREFIRRR